MTKHGGCIKKKALSKTHTQIHFYQIKWQKMKKKNVVRKLYIFSWEIILKKWKKQRKKSKKEQKKYDQVD